MNEMATPTVLYIKGMVCDRCISTIKVALEKLGSPPLHIGLGEVSIQPVNATQMEQIAATLRGYGFELIEDKTIKLVSGIKGLVAEVYSGDYEFPQGFRFSQLLSDRFHRDFDSMSSIFAEQEGTTLEQYLIRYKIDKAKSLLTEGETLASISVRLNYSSMAHLSRQFKQFTGMVPSQFRSQAIDPIQPGE